VYDIIRDTEGGSFNNNLPKFDLAHDGVGYAPVNKDVPADAKAQADTFASQIMAGTLTPPETIP
jgi:basic membrane protein A